MKYILMLSDEERRWATMPSDVMQREMGAYLAYTKALEDAGAYAGGQRLENSSTAATVRVGADGRTTVLDGPYAETKEQLGGFYIIEAPDMESAIAWAARCPCASNGTVEVRPLAPLPVAV